MLALSLLINVQNTEFQVKQVYQRKQTLSKQSTLYLIINQMCCASKRDNCTDSVVVKFRARRTLNDTLTVSVLKQTSKLSPTSDSEPVTYPCNVSKYDLASDNYATSRINFSIEYFKVPNDVYAKTLYDVYTFLCTALHDKYEVCPESKYCFGIKD